MSSPDHSTPWGTPQPPAGGAQPPFGQPADPSQAPYMGQQPSAGQGLGQGSGQGPGQGPGQSAPPPMVPTDSPAPPSMMSPYGVPLAGGGPEGYGPVGPGPGGPGGGPDRRRNALIMSALAVVAVAGIGAGVAVLSNGPSKHDSTALAGRGAAGTSSSDPAGAGAGGATTGGKPDGDSIAADPLGNGAQGANLPNASSVASGTGPTGAANGQNNTPGSSGGNGNGGSTTSAGGHPVAPTSGGQPATSAPGVPAPSNPAPKPSAPSSTTVVVAAGPPSSDCTYLDLPAAQMPVIKEGSSNVNAVKELQCLLKKSELGIKPLVIDGSWGSATQSALSAFLGCNNSPSVKTPGGTPPYPKLSTDASTVTAQVWADLYFWDNQYFNGVSYYCNGTR